MTKKLRSRKSRPEYQLAASDDITLQVIACVYEPPEKTPDWQAMVDYFNIHAVNSETGLPDWQDELIDGRRAIFYRIDDDQNKRHQVWPRSKKRQLKQAFKVAYPSVELKHEIMKALQKAKLSRFYDLIIKRNLSPEQQDRSVYLLFDQRDVSECRNPIYVGQTRQLLQRFGAHKNGAEFMGYVRYNQDSADWIVFYLPFEECRFFAIEGQLLRNLKNDQQARQLLDEKYSKDPKWGLNRAEAALIAYYRPHFNQRMNFYPRPLLYTDYCQKNPCLICNPFFKAK